ncbi:uncharacterized protein LOC110176279 [Drosophila serrata]|uniref:uncharacterized protein LOC110176279 n=1 Tax=Drosophila serrata TaxID=7274 RepID=UPI000A1D1E99|nr:uncharacterized protein LOC110176279 [Drosophila serrata]KAH8368914.1 hypothetical protein KR200_003681 [Drosophila serrata]
MAYETLLNTTYSPAVVCQKKIYTPKKAVKKLFKVACKIFKSSGHQSLKDTSITISTPVPKELPQPVSDEELENSLNEQLEAELVQL